MKLRRKIMLIMAAVILAACGGTTRVVPITGRTQKVYSDNASLLTLSYNEYSKYIKTAKLSTNAANTAMVKRVGQRLANAVETYLKNNGYADEVKNYKWEFNLVQDKQVNAFCMPGGKIVVYEGVLPVTQTETALAIVLGHEIAHAVAYHSSEQQQKQENQQLLGSVVNGVLTATTGANTNTTSVLSSLYGLGSQMATQIGGAVLGAVIGTDAANIATWVGQQGLQLQNLKYSRNHENEADHMGLIFAAMAGYNPQEAITFWQRMSASSQSTTPVWLRTHPTDEQRIANLKKVMPEALKYYKK